MIVYWYGLVNAFIFSVLMDYFLEILGTIEVVLLPSDECKLYNSFFLILLFLSI